MADNILNGSEVESNDLHRTQVFQVTHDGAGNRLPIMLRSFMSFSFGGIPIEDFSLVVTFDARLNKPLYAEFEDAISEYKTVDGHYYWGTRMKDNTLTFTLSTDKMTEKQLEEFKYWFSPGAERDLILAEHPNRCIKARVALPPTMNMLPFGEETKIKIQDKGGHVIEYNTMTTIYKGDVTLNFTMSEPYWRGILNYMPYPGSELKVHMNEQIANLMKDIIKNNSLDSPDAFKICLEDNIPHDISLYGGTAVLGTRAYDNDSSAILARFGTAEVEHSVIAVVKSAMVDLSHADEEDSILGYMLEETSGLDINEDKPQYLFYSGTAPSKPIVKFTMELTINDDGYITHPINSIATPDTQERSYIKVGDKYFYFTTPGICTSYNTVLKILHSADEVTTVFDLKKEIREQVRDQYARAWAIHCLKGYDLAEMASAVKSDFLTKFKQFFKAKSRLVYDVDENGRPTREQVKYYEADFLFNSKTGEAKGIFNCCTTKEPVDGEEIIENIGDMALSNYLIIDKRNYLNENGMIIAGGENNNCTPITTNENLSNFQILFNNMYY